MFIINWNEYKHRIIKFNRFRKSNEQTKLRIDKMIFVLIIDMIYLSETLSVNNGWTAFVVFGSCDPHGLEC